MRKPATLVGSMVFTAVAVAHLFRLIAGTSIVIGGQAIPVWLSAAAVVGAGALAVLMWRERGEG